MSGRQLMRPTRLGMRAKLDFFLDGNVGWLATSDPRVSISTTVRENTRLDEVRSFVSWTPGSFIPAGLELIYHYRRVDESSRRVFGLLVKLSNG